MRKNIVRSILSLMLASAFMISAVCGSSFRDIKAYAADGSSNTIIVKVMLDDNASDKINAALLTAAEFASEGRIYTVKLPAGNYILDKALHIYSNTILDVTGCMLISDESKHNFFILGTNSSYMGFDKYNSSERSKGYDSVRNVTVRGGIWQGNDNNTNTPIRLAHATNVTFENMTVSGSNMSSHQVEAAGINGFYVRNCTFCDFTPLSFKKGHFESIQLDVPINTAVYNSSYLDGTPNRNVEITGCTFSNVSRGVGTHSMLVGAYHSNIRISNNTFENVQEEAIVALNYLNCIISGNRIVNSGGGIIFESAKFRPSSGDNKISSMHTTVFDGQQDYDGEMVFDTNSIITENDINVSYSPLCSRTIGIRIHGLELGEGYVGGDDKPLPAADYYVGNVSVMNNRITSEGGGILIEDAKDMVCSENMIVQANVSTEDENSDSYDGIYITNGSRAVSVMGNTVSGFTRHGILVNGESKTKSIIGNTVDHCGKNGIYCSGSSASDIRCNNINECGEYGIMLGLASNAGEIASNCISGSKNTAIYLTEGSKASSGINGNNIERSGGSGILLNNGKAGGIVNNNVITSSKHGICIKGESKLSGGISSNSVLGTGADGVRIDDSYAVKEISSNMINAADGNGIILSGSSVKGGIKNNKVNKTVYNGIRLTAESRTDSITSNTVSMIGRNGISVCGSGKVKNSISKNTVTGAGVNGILLDDSGSAKRISKNTVKNSCLNGIYIKDKSKLSGNITGNTIKNSKQSGIALDQSSKAGKLLSNEISSSGKNGIYLYSGSRTDVISDNTVKNSKRTGIALGGSSTVKKISSNTITSSKESGISLKNGSDASGGIKKNKITSAQTGIYADESSDINGKLSTNSFGKVTGEKTDIKE